MVHRVEDAMGREDTRSIVRYNRVKSLTFESLQ